MSNNQKSKGNSGERKIADFLSKLYNKKFIRVPNSGAYLGQSNNFRKNDMDAGQISTFKADLIPPSNMRKLVIESKFYKDFPFYNLMKQTDIPLLDKWVQQAIVSSDLGDFWVVIFRINHRGAFAVFDKELMNKFKLENYCIYKDNVVCEFEPFFINNRDVIEELSKSQET